MASITDLTTRNVTPVHEVRDAGKCLVLSEAMAEGGWRGRPLLVADNGICQALTGSHRWAAARDAELPAVPCLVISWADWQRVEEVAGMDPTCGDDADRLRWLAEAGLTDAAELMAAEIDAND